MPHDIAFKVGDQIRCTTGITGNGIIAARSTKDGDITYMVFTDFGNTMRLSELELLNAYVPINAPEFYTDLFSDDVDPVQRWLIDRAALIAEQAAEYRSYLMKSKKPKADRRKAPFKDYAGCDLYEGDTIRHPSGTTAKVVYVKGLPQPFRAGYDDGLLSDLSLQVGYKGRAVKVQP